MDVRVEGYDRLAQAMTESLGYIEATQSTNYSGRKFSWATLSSYTSMIKQVYTPKGLVVVQTFEGEDSVLVSRIVYKGEELASSRLPLRLFLVKDISPQAVGSAMTYAKRYALAALLCCSSDEEDDDAQQAQAEARTEKMVSTVTEGKAPATEKQIGYIRTLMEKKFGKDARAVRNFVAEKTQENWPDLSSRGANELIKELKGA